MSCVKVAIMPSASGFQTLSLQNMSYHQPWSSTTTIVVNSPSTPTPLTRSPPLLSPVVSPSRSSSLSSPSPLSAPPKLSRGYASEIIPRLYISDLSFAESGPHLLTHRITHILSVLPDNVSIPSHPQPTRLQIKVEDFPFAELAAHLPTTTRFIRDALRGDPEARVLVHCAEGISRSVSVVAAFLMAHYGWGPSESIGYIQQKRVVANPNFGFVQQLYEYARDSLGQRVDIPSSPS